MQKHTHGGNIYTYKNCIDFSANCNPLGTSPKVKEAVLQSIDLLADYPRVGCLPLRTAIAAYETATVMEQIAAQKDTQQKSVQQVMEQAVITHDNINVQKDDAQQEAEQAVIIADHILCGNGAAEVIFSLCRAVAPKRALLLAPTFAEYEQALRSVGCEIEYFMLEEEQEFRLDERILDALHEELDLVFICNPNNPTGALTSRSLLEKVLERCRERNILLAVDECFLDFVKEPEAYTLKALIQTYPNLFILKAFTKRYGMAGVRLGYGICGSRELLDRMECMTQPWNVSTLAQNAGIAALEDTEYVEQGRQIVFREREWLCEQMRKLGLKVFEPEANYIFFKGPENLFERCLEQGILIRDCSNYVGLKKGYYRVAVKLHEENQKLLKALADILQTD